MANGGSTVVGSLLVNLGMESAEFTRGATQAQSKIASVGKQFGITGKEVFAASQRMGVSVSQFSSQMTTLQARVNPGVAALANYRKEMNLLREALRIGAISQEQFRAQVQTSVTTYRQAGQGVRQASGNMQSGMQQLQYQLSDVTTMWAMGARPMQIFASQAGQVTQAIALMSNGAGKFGAFMAGPWGMAVTAGVVVLSALIPKLLETESAMKDVEFASNGIADAQGILGSVMDLTTGKITTQSQALKDLAKAQLLVAKVQSEIRARAAQSAITKSGEKVLNFGGGPGGLAISRARPIEGQIESQFRNKAITASEALDKLTILRDRGRISDGRFEELATAYSNYGMEVANQASYQQGLDALAGKGLGSLAKPATGGSKPKRETGPSATEREARYLDEITRLRTDRLNIEADFTGNLKLRYDANVAAIDEELASYSRSLALDKEKTAAQKAALLQQKQANAAREKDAAFQEYSRAQSQQQFDIDSNARQLAIETLQLQASLTDNSRDRLRLAVELLGQQDKLKAEQYEQILANELTTSAEWQKARDGLDALNANRGARRTLTERQNAGPGQSYLQSLSLSTDALNDTVAGIKIDGLEALNDGLADAITGAKSLGDVFRNVSNQIIADLVRIAIQQTVIKPLAQSLFGGGGAGGFLGGVASLFGGGAGAFAMAGSGGGGLGIGSLVAGARASGGPVRAGLPYLVGERGPEIVVPGGNGQVIANHELAGIGGGSFHFDLRGAVMTQDLLAQMNAIGENAAMRGSINAQVAAARKQHKSLR